MKDHIAHSTSVWINILSCCRCSALCCSFLVRLSSASSLHNSMKSLLLLPGKGSFPSTSFFLVMYIFTSNAFHFSPQNPPPLQSEIIDSPPSVFNTSRNFAACVLNDTTCVYSKTHWYKYESYRKFIGLTIWLVPVGNDIISVFRSLIPLLNPGTIWTDKLRGTYPSCVLMSKFVLPAFFACEKSQPAQIPLLCTTSSSHSAHAHSFS